MHIPVLLKEIIEILNPQEGEFFIDGTIGSGGHAAKIFERILPDGKILGIDWDASALKIAELKILAEIKNQKSKIKNNLILINGNYADLSEILKENNLPKADGLLLDLGMSSDQLEHSGRGFSFLRNEPLDMRYQSILRGSTSSRINFNIWEVESRGGRTSKTLTAAEVVNSFSEKELADIFWKYGEEKRSRQIAKRIVEARKKKRILTTFDLVEVIMKDLTDAKPRMSRIPRKHSLNSHNSLVRIGHLHPATKVFQTLRIYVNSELDNLEKLLKNLAAVLKPNGRAAIISFHSLEDRLVKNYFRQLVKQGEAEFLTKKPIRPTKEEINKNPRARSARLRAILMV